MERTLISIIMPVYNSEKYVDDSIKSVLAQTYEKFELIIIDDGSTDKSGKICKRHSEEDSRIIYHAKKNGGVCSARNLGISLSRGKYIAFIDNDDIYTPNYLETLMNIAATTNCEIVKCGRNNIVIDKNGNERSKTFGTSLTDYNMSFFDFLDKYYLLKVSGVLDSVWNGLYKKEFILDSNVKFDEKLRHGNEDMLFNYELFGNHPSVYVHKALLYTHYYRLSHSTSMRFYKDQISTRIEAIEAERKFTDLIKNQSYKNLIEFENIRLAFKILVSCKDKDIRREQIKLIEDSFDFSILKNKEMYREVSKIKKLDYIAFKTKHYKFFFFYNHLFFCFKNYFLKI